MNASARAALLVPIALILALALLPPWSHLFVGVGGWIGLRFVVDDVVRTLGRPQRWLLLLVVLSALGAVFAPADTTVLGLTLSKAGALAGITMVVRAFTLIAFSSTASSVLPVRRWTQRIRHPAARRLIEVVIVASNLAPVLLRSLTDAFATLEERRPGLRRLPERLWLLAVHGTLRASLLAEGVALDMAIAAHNASAMKEIRHEDSKSCLDLHARPLRSSRMRR